MLRKLFKLLFYRKKGECYYKYINHEISFAMKVPYNGRKHKVILTVAPLSFCNDGFYSHINRFKSYGKEFSYVEEFDIIHILLVGKFKSMSKNMKVELANAIYSTNELFDIVCDSIMDYIHEKEAEKMHDNI